MTHFCDKCGKFLVYNDLSEGKCFQCFALACGVPLSPPPELPALKYDAGKPPMEFARIQDVDATLEALRTQYQFCADAIIPRRCQDAPTVEQVGLIRAAHYSVYELLKFYRDHGKK